MTDLLLPAQADINQLWYVVPLIIVISLVYAATRQEEMGPILRHAARRVAVMIVIFMGIAFLVLEAMMWWAAR
jgi:hypothetical protein